MIYIIRHSTILPSDNKMLCIILISFSLFVLLGVENCEAIVGGITAAPPPLDDPVVFIQFESKFARVEGTRNLKTGLYSFRGIRFADPPVGKNRFLRPRYRKLLGDVNATMNGPPCPQPEANNPHRIIGSEDCLLLNIFTPRMPDETTGLPVLVWIHGGGFRYGSAAQYGAEPLVQEDVLFVPIQYRLGTLGLFGEGTREFSGNVAFFDIEASLRWVQDYISFFGGDPKQIKIIGHGSGASAAMYVSTAMTSRKAVSGVIAMSGTSLSQYTYDTEPVRTTAEIAQTNDCPMLNETELIHCMQNKTFEQIIENDSDVQTERLAGRNMVKSLTGGTGFIPVIETDDDKRGLPGFITETPEDSLTKEDFHAIPLLTGLTKDETANGFLPEKIKNVFSNATDFLGTVANNIGLQKFLNVADKLKSSVTNIVKLPDYLQIPDTLNPQEILKKMTEVTTDVLFSLPLFIAAQSWSKYAPAYIYSFEHVGNVSSSGKRFLAALPLVSTASQKEVVAHGDELGFLFDSFDVFGVPIPDIQLVTERDKKARQSFLKVIVNFAHLNSNSSKKDTSLFQAFNTKGTPYIKISDKLESGNDFKFCQLKTLGASIDAIATGSCEILGILGNTLTNTVSKIENPIAALNVFGGATKKPTKKAYFGLF